jgi:hypothetical protein
MIAALRNRHRWMAPLFIGIVPGVVLVAGIVGRLPAPLESIESNTAIASDQTTAPVKSRGLIWEGLGFEVSFKWNAARYALIVDIVDPPLKPDLLLYWIPVSAEVRTPADSAAAQLPATAVFLGALKETRQADFDLPPRTLEGEGRIVLYSLPYREVVSVSTPVKFD